MDTSIADIMDFFELAEKTFNVNISFHTIYCKGFLKEHFLEIGRFNSHCSKFCSCVKSNQEMALRCQKQQNIILKKCGSEVFYGMSYCGMEEFIVPIRKNNIVYGFICVGGFCSDYEKSMKRAERNRRIYGMDLEKMSAYLRKMKKPELSERMVKTIFKMAADILAEYMSGYDIRQELKKNIYSEIVAYITLNYTKNISVCDISRHCYCSESYINHTFKKLTNKSVSQYINELRIKKAKELLNNTDLSIKEISEKVGFSESNYFSNVFKSCCYMSPKAYRQQNKG